ncbi:aminopeptidase N [Consotaella salsifontis]|uniref:Aminopeptidase N n=1 Tax=Consotaella salsifontis TaxID=1365950 RepID=A0A1T4SW64_9HYPH|nr:aminopeptidase N [Consotaella salsifontis]SKA32510.1 aminopeptidase N [Consotaella salsifontis]
METDQGQIIRLEDYRPSDFVIHRVDMTVRLFEGFAEVSSKLTMERRAGTSPSTALVLDGDELTLTALALNGTPLPAERYAAKADELRIEELPAAGPFELTVETRIAPEANTKLMGLYRSNGIWCTQCEAEGFRRITYYLDRPDVLAVFRVRVEADRRAAPILLSNGNPAEKGPLAEGRHFAVWDDPFPKPCYLFALVAGDLDALHDSFVTASGRDVALAIYTEKGLSPRASYAMDALKRSMTWDERRFGREYDLDVFSIVAISDFNMGAMENKGLNVFNHRYVLLDADTATDADYAGVETVIAHEYFHNWTGDRITCRDWFQLCLKEGLTVFRDQEFSADERSRPVKRIASVRTLKAHQYPEDQGPLQHSVRPHEYREINNFYTSTVYEKGAELVRMIETILGRTRFRAGMDLYFERHDGEAATVEDFIRCFEEAGEVDLSQFMLWYDQAGTPTLTVESAFDAKAATLTLTLRQELTRGAAKTGIEPMHIPIRFGLVGPNGEDMSFETVSGAKVEGDVIHLTRREERVVFGGLGNRPLLSILRDFSAPVTLISDETEQDRLALARLDPNPFNRWRALSDSVSAELKRATESASSGSASRINPDICEALVSVAADGRLDPELRAQTLSLPGESEIARLIGENIDPDAVHAARNDMLRAVGEAGREVFSALRAEMANDAPFSPAPESAGRRALANAALEYVAVGAKDPAIAARQFAAARNMTDRLSALSVLINHFPEAPASVDALALFYERHKGDTLVMDKWFAIQAAVPRPETLEAVRQLESHPLFTLTTPNRVRALVGTFASGNQVAFNRADGDGYRWVGRKLLEIDRLNPQVAARVATAFRSWRSFEAKRRAAAQATLEDLANQPNLSVDLRDIVDRSLR